MVLSAKDVERITEKHGREFAERFAAGVAALKKSPAIAPLAICVEAARRPQRGGR